MSDIDSNYEWRISGKIFQEAISSTSRRILGEISQSKPVNVTIRDEFLSDDELDREIQASSYLFLAYPDWKYGSNFLTNGVLYKKKIICLRNTYIADVATELGLAGVMQNSSKEDLFEALRNIKFKPNNDRILEWLAIHNSSTFKRIITEEILMQLKVTPVAIFLFNRPNHTRNLLSSILKCNNHDSNTYFIFIDGPRDPSDYTNIAEVKDIVEELFSHLNVKVIVREQNLGLAHSIISATTELLKLNECLIVLEDDLVLHPEFFRYMEQALDYYKNKDDVISISGYQPIRTLADIAHSTYLAPRIHSWGWATWSNRWENIDWDLETIMEFCLNEKAVSRFDLGGADLVKMLFDQINGKVNSWAIRFNYHAAKMNAYTVYPNATLVLNRGFDGSGVHCGQNLEIQTQTFDFRLDEESIWEFATEIEDDKIKLFRESFG